MTNPTLAAPVLAEADALLGNAGLPTYTELVTLLRDVRNADLFADNYAMRATLQRRVREVLAVANGRAALAPRHMLIRRHGHKPMLECVDARDAGQHEAEAVAVPADLASHPKFHETIQSVLAKALALELVD